MKTRRLVAMAEPLPGIEAYLLSHPERPDDDDRPRRKGIRRRQAHPGDCQESLGAPGAVCERGVAGLMRQSRVTVSETSQLLASSQVRR